MPEKFHQAVGLSTPGKYPPPPTVISVSLHPLCVPAPHQLFAWLRQACSQNESRMHFGPAGNYFSCEKNRERNGIAL
jgi:hypothetical protein